MRILVVDDDSLSGELTGAVLEGLGHSPVLADNGIDATDKLNANPDIQMILSDMNMPMVSGIELFRELREQGIELPFILLTGDEPAQLLAEEPRLDACVRKDFDLADTLPQVMATVLARYSLIS